MIDKNYLRNEVAAHPICADTCVAEFGAHITMFSAQKTVCVGWLASQTDMLAEDWIVFE